MGTAERGPDERGIDPFKAMAGVLALMVEEREARLGSDGNAVKTEVLLAQAGLSNEEIATVMGKKPDAVRMAIQRAKAKAKAKS